LEEREERAVEEEEEEAEADALPPREFGPRAF
jgi:hypothetical protein